MGRYRSKEEKCWALIKWRRRLFKKCPRRRSVDQEPLPQTQVGDHIMVWREETAGFYQSPASVPLWYCGCTGGFNRQHAVIPQFLKVLWLRKSYAAVSPVEDLSIIFEIYQPSIIFNIGQSSPLDPKQDFSMLRPAQKRFIIDVFTTQDKKAS